MEIKKLDISDFENVLSFYKEQIEYLERKEFFYPYQNDDIKSILSGGGIMAAVLDSSKIIGLSAIDFDDHYSQILKEIANNYYPHVSNLQVCEYSGVMTHKDYRGQGVAGKLYDYLINIVKDRKSNDKVVFAKNNNYYEYDELGNLISINHNKNSYYINRNENGEVLSTFINHNIIYKKDYKDNKLSKDICLCSVVQLENQASLNFFFKRNFRLVSVKRAFDIDFGYLLKFLDKDINIDISDQKIINCLDYGAFDKYLRQGYVGVNFADNKIKLCRII